MNSSKTLVSIVAAHAPRVVKAERIEVRASATKFEQATLALLEVPRSVA
jgi:hypothetical protein